MKMPTLTIVILAALLISLSGCDNGGGSSTAPQALGSPARVAAVDSGADIVVTDYSEDKFCLIDKSTLAVSSCFTAKGQPTGIAYVDFDGGRYYVGNKSVRSVDIYDAQGNLLGHLGGSIGLFGRVNDLAYDSVDQQLFVLDSERKEIKLYELDGSFTGVSFGPGVLIRPTAIDYDPVSGSLFVSDFGDPASGILPRIKILDQDGFELDEIAAIETGGLLNREQTFSSPQGMAIYNGHLFVVDSGPSEVQVYNLATKAQVKVIGILGEGDGKLFYPLDVFVDPSNGDVFVTDNRNGRVAVYRGEGEVP
jgi:DNA-binding beta-propeller fold protein YncE